MSSLLHAIGAIPNFTDIIKIFVMIYKTILIMKTKKLNLGIVGGGSNHG